MNIKREELDSVGLSGNIFTPDKLKQAYLKNWQKSPKSINFCIHEINNNKATGYAVVTGNKGLIGLDFDGRNADRIAFEAIPWAIETNTLTWSSGRKNRKSKLFRLPEYQIKKFSHITRRTIKTYTNIKEIPGEALEFHNRGCKLTLPPSAHPETDGYKWLNFVSIHELIDSETDSLLDFLHISYDNYTPTKKYTLTDTIDIDKAIAIEALDYINSDLPYIDWIKIGTGLKNMGFDFSVWDSWSSKGEKYTETNLREMERKWQGFNNTQLGIQTILYYADGFDQTQSKAYTLTDKKLINKDKSQLINCKSNNKNNSNIKEVNKPNNKQKSLAYTFDEFVELCGTGKTEYLVDTFIPKGEMIILHGASGTGKTRLALDLAYAMLADGTFLGESVKAGKVLLIASDQSKHVTKRTLELRGFDLLNNRNDFFVCRNFQLNQLKLLRQILTELNPDLVIFDSLTSITSEIAIDENKAEIAKAVKNLREVLESQKTSSVLIHHDNKNIMAKGRDKMAGSSRLQGVCHSTWGLSGIQSGLDKVLWIKSREDNESTHTLRFNEEDDWTEKGFLNYIGEVGFSNQDKSQVQQIIDLLVNYPDGLSRKELELELPHIKGINKVLSRATKSGKIETKRHLRVPKGFIYYVANLENNDKRITRDTLVRRDIKNSHVSDIVSQPNIN